MERLNQLVCNAKETVTDWLVHQSARSAAWISRGDALGTAAVVARSIALGALKLLAKVRDERLTTTGRVVLAVLGHESELLHVHGTCLLGHALLRHIEDTAQLGRVARAVEHGAL